jgi:hypothetical protein
VDRISSATSLALLLTLCACNTSKPAVVTVRNGNEAQLSCPELQQEIQTAQYYKEAARSEDRFMLKHINPFTTFFSIYNMNKAESHAQQRIEILEQFYKQRRCDQQQTRSNNAPPYATPYYQGQQPSNYYQQQPITGMPATGAMPTAPNYYQPPIPMGDPTGALPQGQYPQQDYGIPPAATAPTSNAQGYYQQQIPMGDPTAASPQGQHPQQGYGIPPAATPNAAGYHQQPLMPNIENGASPEDYYPGGAPYPYNTQN